MRRGNETPGRGPAVIDDSALPAFGPRTNSKIEITLLSAEKMGHGVRTTQAYETNLNEGDLEKWRQDFWGKIQLHVNQFVVNREEEAW